MFKSVMNTDTLNLIFDFLWYYEINIIRLVCRRWNNLIINNNYQYKRILIKQLYQIFPINYEKKFIFISPISIQNYFFFIRQLPNDFFDLTFLQNDQNLIETDNYKIYFKGTYEGRDRTVFLNYHVPLCKPSNSFLFPVLRDNTYKLFISNVYYFELKVDTQNFRESWENECISVGFCDRQQNKGCIGYQVGWLKNTFGYHSDDGIIFSESSYNKIHTNQTWGPGDIIGAGIIFVNNRIQPFFTKNGKIVSQLNPKKINNKYLLTPAISIDSSYGIEVNLGQKEFIYPIENIILDYYKKPKKINYNSCFLDTKNIYKKGKEKPYKDDDQLLEEISYNFLQDITQYINLII